MKKGFKLIQMKGESEYKTHYVASKCCLNFDS